MEADDLCVSFLVRQVWLTMRAAVADALTAHDLSVAQYATLLVLDEQPGASIAEIARAVASSRQAANELVTGMERAGLLQRRAHPQDRRTQEVHLTATGQERLTAARPAVREREHALESGIDPADRAAARAWLTAMSRAQEA